MSGGSDTLVLNVDGMPLSILPLSAISWKEAIKKVWSEEASILHVYDDWVVRSPSVAINVPAVIALNDYHKSKTMVRFTRANVFLRDEFRCQYCNDEFQYHELTYDHVHPQSKGGKTNWVNISSACAPCNRTRGCNTKIAPIKAPYKPTYWEMVNKRKRFPVVVPHESWTYYLDWNPELITVQPKKK